MSEYLEANMVRKYTAKDGSEKNKYTRIGVAFPYKNGKGYFLNLDAIPVPELIDGKLKLSIALSPPYEEKSDGTAKPADTIDDSIDF